MTDHRPWQERVHTPASSAGDRKPEFESRHGRNGSNVVPYTCVESLAVLWLYEQWLAVECPECKAKLKRGKRDV